MGPYHPDPNCPACHGTGSVPFDMDENHPEEHVGFPPDTLSRRPCGPCLMRECGWCRALLPEHAPDCGMAAQDARVARQRAVPELLREFTQRDPMSSDGDGQSCDHCSLLLAWDDDWVASDHDATCLWRRACEALA